LENYAHHQCQRDECRDIRVERDVAYHLCRHTVSAEEAEGDGKQHEVAHQDAEQEEHVDDAGHLYGIAPLVLVEGGRYEAEQLIYNIRRSPEQPQIHGRRDMRHELARQVGGYHVHMELVEAKVNAYRLHSGFQPAVGTEVPLARCQQDLPGDVLETEHHRGRQPRHSENAEEHLAEHLQMSAKCQQIAITPRNVVILMLLFLY